MPDFLALATTFAAGLVSFAAPCTLPLVPAYLAYAAGLTSLDLSDSTDRNASRGRLLLGTALFVLGFAIVFVALGVAAGGIGHAVHGVSNVVQVLGGILIALFGVALAGIVPIPGVGGAFRQFASERMRGFGLGAALPFGIVFGIGWTPCVGPLLGSALALAAVAGHAVDGAILLGAYSLGLGLPFIAAALAWASFPNATRRLSRMGARAQRIMGLLVAGVGVAVATGLYSHVTSFLAQFTI